MTINEHCHTDAFVFSGDCPFSGATGFFKNVQDLHQSALQLFLMDVVTFRQVTNSAIINAVGDPKSSNNGLVCTI